MSLVTELPSGDVQFVDSELEAALAEVEEGERVDMLVRAVCSRDEFMDAVQEESFGRDCEAIGVESMRIDLSAEECGILLDNEVVEALELNRPLKLLE